MGDGNRDEEEGLPLPSDEAARAGRPRVPSPARNLPLDWQPPAEAPVPPPLGDRPLPELEPLGPRRRSGPSFDRPRQAPEQPRIEPRDPVAEQRRRKPLWRRALFLLLKLVLAFLLLSVAMVGVYRFVNPPVTWTMIGDVFSGHGISRRWMPLSRIDRTMPRAAIAAEDARFCLHNGFDFAALSQAFIRNQQGGRIRGGSTISQQTAKNVFLWQGGGYFRKGLEAYFTVLIENIWGKRRIMEVYLNVAETGIGTYGVNAGSLRYYKHDASHLTQREAAQIAAVLPLPKKRAGIDPRGYTRRYGNAISRRIGVVAGDGLDGCLR